MKKIICLLLMVMLLTMCFMTACGVNIIDNGGKTDKKTEEKDDNSTENQDDKPEKQDDLDTDVPDGLEEGINTLTVITTEGTDGCWTFSGKTLTFSGLDADTLCTIAGAFDGRIIIDAGEDYKFELELDGVTIFCGDNNPIEVVSGDKVTISAKKDSDNYIYDTRAAVSSDDDAVHAAAVFSDCNLDLEGKGKLTVISNNNNGIHSKDTLTVKNITLAVTCADNAFKGNDGVEIEGGVLTLIAKSGDGIKTVNSDLSAKGNQRGTVSVTAGTVNIYAACDGIDASYNVEIGDEAIVNIYTDSNSPYSETVEKTEDGDVRYIRFTSKNYSYSVKYYNNDTDYIWVNASLDKTVNGGRTTYYYYSFEKNTGYDNVQIFVYSNGQSQGQDNEYTVCTDYLTWNGSYDTFAIESRNGSLGYAWTNYSSSANGMGGWGGGPGGMNDGNSDKGDYSTKGIKAANEILISGGTVYIEAYDDAIHADGDANLDNGEKATGNIIVSGGNISVASKDDGVHAGGTLTVEGGNLAVTQSYEGLEGTTINIRGGNISVVSSDDGFNATTTSGIGINFDGGNVYVYAGGDGLDSNSRTSYQGIVFAGGDITVVSTSSMNSSIDTEQGYTYTGGTVLAICPSNGMGSESANCKNFNSIGKKTTGNLKQGQTVSATVNGKVTASVEMPCQLSALIIYLGNSGADISVG